MCIRDSLKVAEVLVYGLAEDGLRLFYCVAVIDHKVTDTENLSVIKMVFRIMNDGAVIAPVTDSRAHERKPSFLRKSTASRNWYSFRIFDGWGSWILNRPPVDGLMNFLAEPEALVS